MARTATSSFSRSCAAASTRQRARRIWRCVTTTRCRWPGWPRRTAAGCRRRTSGTCSARCGAPSGRAEGTAGELVSAMTAPDATERIRAALQKSEEGAAGLDDVDNVLSLVSLQVPAGRVRFTPRLVRGLSYYTGPIWELTAPGVAGSMGGGGRYDHLIAQLGGPDVPATGTSLGVERILSLLPDDDAGQRGRLDVAVTVMGEELAAASFDFAAIARGAGLRASVYLGSSGKLGRQL